ncbi:MAG: glycosyltransferase [Eubacterium sp.]|nr:glycosyltransferase [Eubacterium sp.]
MKDVKISVIIPVYKVEKYLNKCIDSILEQSLKEFEVILVDDGSPDNCPLICDEYAKKDQRIRVIHKKNGGLSDARNAGLNVAKGQYVAFVDSDDYIAPKMLEILYCNITSSCADLAICNYVKVAEKGCLEESSKYEISEKKEYNQNEFMEEILKPYGGFFVPVWNKLYKKDIFDDLRFPYGKVHEDEFVIHYIVQKCKKIICLPEKCYYYLQRETSIMGQGFSVKRMDFGEALIERYHFTKKQKYTGWKNHTVIRLSFELEAWRKYAEENEQIRKRYNKLRKKSLFLLFEKQAWAGLSIKGKIYNRMRLLVPKYR